MKKLLLILIALIAAGYCWSADLEVKAYVNRTTIGIKDVLYYTIEIAGADADKIGTPQLPKLDGFDNLGSSKSSSSSFTIVNGRMESSVTNEYRYTLKPNRKGKISIPSITLQYKKQNYKTTPININVIDGSNEPAPPNAHSSKNSHSSTSDKLSDNVFIDAEISNKNPFLNEPVEVTYTIYTKYDITSLSFDEEPSFVGFWKEDAFSARKVAFHRKSRNGELFNAMKLKTYALFPSKTGRIIIEPLRMNVDIRTENRSFFSIGSSKTYNIASDPISINVQELPAGAPDSFSGSVGSFRLVSSISQNNLKVGDSFTYSLEISGKGNFYNLQMAALPNINHLRFLDPETSSEVFSDKITGKKTLRYLVIAQEPGQFEIPSLPFSFFDPQLKKYRTLRSDKYQLHVEEGDSIFFPGSSSQASVQLEGSDIGFIIENDHVSHFHPWFESIYYWLAIFLIFISLPITSLLLRRKSLLAENLDYQRQKRAQLVLKKYLKLATQFHKDANPSFYAAVASGLENYLTDKLKIPRGSRQDDIITKTLELEFPQNIITDLKILFKRCNEARFMPGGFSKQNIDEDFAKLKLLISDISRIKVKGK